MIKITNEVFTHTFYKIDYNNDSDTILDDRVVKMCANVYGMKK